MSTALQLVNKVLRRLREDEVTDFTASYTKLILDFVNEAKEEVENAWNWTMLRTTIDITTVSGTRQYALTGSGNRYRILKGEDGLPLVFNTTEKYRLFPVPNKYFSEASLTTTTGSPTHYRIYGQGTNGDAYVEFNSVPGGIYTIRFNMVIPSDELTATTDTVAVPDLPIVLGAWTKAISERGEDGGQNTIEQQLMYLNALADAIAMDEARAVEETTWQQA